MKPIQFVSILLWNWKMFWLIGLLLGFSAYIIITGSTLTNNSPLDSNSTSSEPINAIFATIIFNLIGPLFANICIQSFSRHNDADKSCLFVDNLVVLLASQLNSIFSNMTTNKYLTYLENPNVSMDVNTKTLFNLYDVIKDFPMNLLLSFDEHATIEYLLTFYKNKNELEKLWNGFKNDKKKMKDSIQEYGEKKREMKTVFKLYDKIFEHGSALSDINPEIIPPFVYNILVFGALSGLSALVPIYFSLYSWIWGILGLILSFITFFGLFEGALSYQPFLSFNAVNIESLKKRVIVKTAIILGIFTNKVKIG